MKKSELKQIIRESLSIIITELFETPLDIVTRISPVEFIVTNGLDIEAKYHFRKDVPETNEWSIHWSFTDKNKDESPKAWAQVTATIYKVIIEFLKIHRPTTITISGDTQQKTNLYKSGSFLKHLENVINNIYDIDNSDKYNVKLKLIENSCKKNIEKRMESLNESYEQSLNYWNDGDFNAKSKIERIRTIKKLIIRECTYYLYKIQE